MRNCASCHRQLGSAFASSPICPCCGGGIDVASPVQSDIVPLTDAELAETLLLIVSRAATSESADSSAVAPGAPPATPLESATDEPASSHPTEPEGAGRTQYFGSDWQERLSSSKDLAAAAAAQAAAAPPAAEQAVSPTAPPTAVDPAAVDPAAARPAADMPMAPLPFVPKSDERVGAGDVTHDDIQATMQFVPAGSPQPPPTDDRADAPPADSDGTAAAERESGNWTGTVSGSSEKRPTVRTADGVNEDPSLIVNRRLLAHVGSSEAADADYQLIDVIGEGGIGVVYAARQASIDRTVALKMLRSAERSDQQQRGKFLTEAVITGELDHPNIVPIYDLAANQQGALFYSMKRVRGTPWNKVVRKKSLTENLEILMKTADAVAFAHSRHVVHRDLKPENVMLGDFGEVLLMDWGLAVSGVGGRRRGPQGHDPGMGGTPAYMSPEMAVGPLSRIDTRSDVYLLGAVLYEIITGKPPHTGPNVMACLFAAAQNQIVPTERDDELVRIALQAMASEPDDRFPTVKDFQNAIRDYQSHAESVLLSVRAAEHLAEGRRSGSYQDFSRAVFGFQQAEELWTGNSQARSGIVEAQAAYAEQALDNADIDLALSLLDADEPQHAAVRRRALLAQKERDQRQQRLVAAKRMALALSALVVAVGIGAYVQISRDRDRAIVAEAAAHRDQEAAVAAEREAQRAAALATDEAERARRAELLAKQESERARTAEQKALDAQAEALVAAKAAQAARENESYEAYVARIGLAAAKIDENSFDSALQLLAACEQRHRRWEWGRLDFLCGRYVNAFRAEAPVDCVVVSPDGRRVAAATWDHRVEVWNLDGTGKPSVVPYDSQYVHAVAFSPDGGKLALGGSDRKGYVVLCDADTGAVQRKFEGHTDGVLGVSFSQDGRRLLTCSYDATARLWDVATGRELQVFEGHNWWVWSASFAPPEPGEIESRIVTAGQDGVAFVWNITTGEPSPPFRGHQGPLYAARFSPDGRFVATAGADKRVLLWDPADLRPFDFAALSEDRPAPPPKFATLEGHTAAVRTLAFAADGKRLASGGHDNTVRVWDVAVRTPIKTMRGHAGWIRSNVFTADGRVVSGSHDRRVLVWDVDKYEEQRVIGRRVLQGHSDAVLAAAFSPDDARLVTAGRDHTARLWNVASGETERQFVEGHAFLASQAVFFPPLPQFDGQYPGGRIVTAGVDGTARIWDVARGVEITRFEPAGRASAVAVSHDGKKLLTGTDGNGATLWDVETGKPLHKLDSGGDETVVVAFAADDATLLTGESSGACRVWNAADGRLLRTIDVHRDRITGMASVRNGARVLIASADNTVSQWDGVAGRELTDLALRHPEPVTSLAVDAAGRIAVTGCSDGRVRLWTLDEPGRVETLFSGDAAPTVEVSRDGRRAILIDPVRRNVRQWDLEMKREIAPPQVAQADVAAGLAAGAPFLDLEARGELVWTARYADDGRRFLTVGGDGASLWDSATGDRLRHFSPHGAVAAVDFSTDGRFVATGGWDHTVKIWNVDTGRAVAKLEGIHTGNINAVDFAPDGKRLLTASDDGTVRLYDIAEDHTLDIVLKHRGPIKSARFDTDGKRIITGGDDKKARIWDAATGAMLLELAGHDWAVNAATFSPDGLWAATGGGDNSAVVWNAATGETVCRLEGHTAAVVAVAFTQDGTRLLTGAQDNLAKVWDARTGKEILTLRGHTEEITCVAFSHDDRYALTTGRDGTAVLWPAADWLGGEILPLAPDAKTSKNNERP